MFPFKGFGGAMTPLLIFIVTIFLLVAWKVRKIFSYWEDKGIPHQGFWQYMRVVYQLFTKPLHVSVIDDYRKYGRLYGSYQDTDPCLVVGEPDLLREVYIKDFSSFVDRTQTPVGQSIWDRSLLLLSGAEWKYVRSIFSGAFTTTRLKAMVPKLVRVANRTADAVVEHATNKEPVDVHDVFMKSSLDAIAAVAFNADTDSIRDPNNPFMNTYFNVFTGATAWKILLYFKMPRLFKFLRLSLLTKEHLDKFSVFVERIVEERLKSKTKFNDQLQVFLDALQTEVVSDQNGESSNELTSGKRLTMDDIVAQVLVLLLGGNDTIASALHYLTYSLVSQTEYQDKVIEEIDRVIGKEELTYEKLQSLEYLEAAINETLRMYTPDSFLSRYCTKKTTLQGIELNPGNIIYIPVQAMHMDSEFYEEPETFKPERFLPENKDYIRPFTFLPFGAGPRNCIGIRQAMMQLKIFIVCIYQKVKFERCRETPDHLDLKPGFILRELRKRIKLAAVQRP
ncbi:cytochrome P450 3A6-like [Ornithodoros turicata]|uniref:cytochrome P450 3A6-like n=1 Tax=Ornithodoros turicata TaxID=34597 RepID=UPI003138F712